MTMYGEEDGGESCYAVKKRENEMVASVLLLAMLCGIDDGRFIVDRLMKREE